MSGVAAGRAEYVYTARRNNSLSSTGRLLVFGFFVAVSLGIAIAFTLIAGAWPILPYSGIELTVLYFAFRYIDRHAADYERVTIRGSSVAVEVRDGESCTHLELNRHWAQVVCEAEQGRVALRSHGREIEIGRLLPEEQRLEMGRELARELREHRIEHTG